MILPWKRVVCWGAGNDQDSLRWPMFAYRDTARKLGMDAMCVPDVEASRAHLGPGVLCIAANVWQRHLGEAVPGTDYVLHNFDASHPVRQTADPARWIAMQVYTDDAAGRPHESWDVCRLWDCAGRVVYFPWGATLLGEEFYEPVFNAGSTEAVFVGAIWDDSGQGNAATIPHVKRALERRRLRFAHYTQISESAMTEVMRSARLCPAFAGPWQVEKNYLNCRTFKAISYGQLPCTNVARFRDIFGDALPWGETVEELLDACLSLSGKQWTERVRDLQRTAARYTYRANLENIARAFAEISDAA